MVAGMPWGSGTGVPVAAPAHLAGVLGGRPHPGTVLSSGPAAAYLRLDPAPDGPAAGCPVVLGLVAADAVAVPCALLLPAGQQPWRLVSPGERVLVGGGAVTCPAEGGRRLVVRRWWTVPALPRGQVDRDGAARLAALLAAAPVLTSAPAARAARAAAPAAAAALAAGDASAAAGALCAVLGLGPGSTPSGDDVAAGVLLAARAVRTPPGALEPVAAAVDAAAHAATGAVSAALLHDAAAGRCAAVVAGAVAALLGRRPPQPALGALLALGHTSGADLATGMLAVATAVPPHPPARPHPRRRPHRPRRPAANRPPDPHPSTEDALMGTRT